MPVSREQVIAAYRLLLAREPESEDVIANHLKAPDLSALLSAFITSSEFVEKHSWARPRSKQWVWTDTRYGFRLRVNLADRFVSGGIIEDQFEPSEASFILAHVHPGDTVLDIGANLGFFTHLMASVVGPEGCVYAFEPMSFLYDSLCRSLAENGFEDRAKAFNVALADKESAVPLVYAPESDNWGGAYLSFDGNIPFGHATEQVRVARLENVVQLSRLNFIKIDVEGAEPLVLSACADVLRRFRPIILSELHPTQVRRVSGNAPSDYLSMMRGLGYEARALVGDAPGPVVSEYKGEVPINLVFCPL